MLPAAYSERGDDDGRSGDENKQHVDDSSAGQISNCDYNEFEEILVEGNCVSIATDESIVGDGGTPTPDGPFTITGQGSGIYTCLGGPPESASISISAEEAEDGSVTGTVTILLASGGTEPSSPVSGGTTDGNTFSLTGETSTGILCGGEVQQFTVSGDCGTAATITYEEPDVSATFTGDVECTFA